MPVPRFRGWKSAPRAVAATPWSGPVGRGVGRGLRAALVAGLLAGWAFPTRGAEEPRDVLVLFSFSRLVPANVELEAGLREALRQSGGPPAELFEEFLDLPRFDRPEYLQAMQSYLREKYAIRPPAVVVAAGTPALRFLLEHRDALFQGAPVVAAVTESHELEALRPLPDFVLAVPSDTDFAGTLAAALRLHPRARRLVLVTGGSPRDRDQEAVLRREARAFEDRVAVEFLAALPTREVLGRLAALAGDSVVVTPGYFEDGDGLASVPRESVQAMAAASAAPVYGLYSTVLGDGIVGGRMIPFETIGRAAGEVVGRLLQGATVGSIGPPERLSPTLFLDWRQVRRWGIDERLVPAGAVVRFRSPGFFEEHRAAVLAAAAVFAVQTSLIVLLLAERRRRRAAEVARQSLRSELAHASRLAIAGELLGSIAHEINQPLGAILANTDAAELILGASGDRRPDLSAILADIRRDDLRASEVIRRLRSLLAKREVERRPVDLAEAALEVESLLRAEARRRGVMLEIRPPAAPVIVAGDRIQLQQVIINLVLNGMDAVAGGPEERRAVAIAVANDRDGAVLTVRDRGPGIAPEHLPKLFESFFTTKSQGMGLGLAIARTLVEAHGGRLRVDNRPGEGAAFHVELPHAEVPAPPAEEPA